MDAIDENQDVIGRLDAVRMAITRSCLDFHRSSSDVSLVCVSKTFGCEEILPALQSGQRVFGENRVQEAAGKWPALRKKFPDVELHLIGPLQSNKAGEAVELFDVIETVDREKIAVAISEHSRRLKKIVPCFVQVNTGAERQKAGIAVSELGAFLQLCREDLGLKVEGLMCIPPANHPASPHFALLNRLARQYGLPKLSMGMSSDFELAIQLGATHVRVGSAIFGQR